MVVNYVVQMTLQSSTGIANPQHGQLFSTQIKTIGLNYFKFTIVLMCPAQRLNNSLSDCLIVYILHHKACIAGAEPTDIRP